MTSPFKDQVIRWITKRHFNFNLTHLSEILEERRNLEVMVKTLWPQM